MGKVNEEIKELDERISILMDASEEWKRGNENEYIREILQRELQEALNNFYNLKTSHLASFFIIHFLNE